MNVGPYLHLIPEIEKLIVDSKLDSLVFGLGPTAWLTRYMQRKVTANLRLWGAHDGSRILPMDDLLLLDQPIKALDPDTNRFGFIVESRPKRIWIYHLIWDDWMRMLPDALKSIANPVQYGAWRQGQTRVDSKFKLETNPLHTHAVSPTGLTTLAWREGCRRIGVIGADMQLGRHHTAEFAPTVDAFFAAIARQAHERGGLIVNLSPISSLSNFRAWTRSASSSAPTASSETTEPKTSSSTQSASS